MSHLVSQPRRRLLIAGAGTGLLGACASHRPSAPTAPLVPIVFVHGNGDSAALWMTTMWRFESHGWPRERLMAIDVPNPLARDDDGVPQAGRSSTAEHMLHLKTEVERFLGATGASRVALVGNSRGGYAIRNYIANGAGAPFVSHAVLGGTPNHGVWSNPGFRPGSEFNGAGPFLRGLNAPRNPQGDEVVAGVNWLTLRSDNNDKFAQPDGVWIGAAGTPTGVTAEGPALKGARNEVLPGRDHREVSFHPQAFAATHAFLTGRAPASTAIAPEAQVVLNGRVSGLTPAGASNLPLPGATVEVHAVDPATGERRGPVLHRQQVGADGLWGPLRVDGRVHLEFVVMAAGYPFHHVYRSPFPRSSSVVHLRLERLADIEADVGSVVTLTRPRGYFGVPRDQIMLDGVSPPVGIPRGVAGVAQARVKLKRDAIGRAVAAEFNGERLVGRAWPVSEGRLVVLELHS